MTLLLLTGCGRPAGVESARASGRTEIVAENRDLRAVLLPDLQSLKASSRVAVQRRELLLEQLLEDPDTSAAVLGSTYGELGKAYKAFGYPESAVNPLLNARQLQPGDFRWPYYLAHIYRELGQVESAVEALGRAQQIRPRYLAAMVLLAEIREEMLEIEEARALFREALELDERCGRAWFGLGRLAALEGDHQEAVRAFNNALRVQPQASAIHYPLGLAYRALGDLERAEYHVRKQGLILPGVTDPVMDSLELTNPAHVADRGTQALRAGNLPVAVRALRQAVQLEPADAELRIRLGVALARSGNVQGALEQYEEASRLAPENPGIPYNVGTLLSRQGRREEAVGHLVRAVELNPDHKHAHFNLGQTLRHLGRYEDSLTHLERTIDLDPRHHTARLWLFKVLMQLSRYERALQVLEGHLAIYPEDPVARHALARFLAVCPADAVRDGERAVELALSVVAEQDSPEHRRTVAMTLAEAGRFAEAAKWQSETLERVKGQVPAPFLETMQAELALYQRGSPVRLSSW